MERANVFDQLRSIYCHKSPLSIENQEKLQELSREFSIPNSITHALNEVFDKYDVKSLDAAGTYQTAEEFLGEERIPSEATKEFDKLFAILLCQFQDSLDSLVRNPMHICLFIKDSKAKITKVKQQKLPTKKRTQDKYASPPEKYITSELVNEYEMVDHCDGCDQILDHHPDYFVFKALLGTLKCLDDWASKTGDLKVWEEKTELALQLRTFLLDWMKTATTFDVQGYFYYRYHDQYEQLFNSKLQKHKRLKMSRSGLFQYMTEIHTNFDFHSGLREIDADYLADLEWILEKMNRKGSEFPELLENSDDEQDDDSCCAPRVQVQESVQAPDDIPDAKFIVNSNGERSVSNGTFHLPDLKTALKIANDGDKILVRPGTYSVGESIIKKSISLIGQDLTVKIEGSKFWFHNNVTMKNISFENCIFTIQSKCDLITDNCHIQSSEKTVIWMQQEAKVQLDRCIIDGAENHDEETVAERLICPFGNNEVSISKCLISNITCVIGVQSVIEKSSISISECVFEGCQQLCFLQALESDLNLDKVKFDMSIEFSEDDQDISIVHLNGIRKVNVTNVVIEAVHSDFKGFQFLNCQRVFLQNIFISGEEKLLQETSIGTAIEGKNVDWLSIHHGKIANLRKGIDVEAVNELKLNDIVLEQCSAGIWNASPCSTGSHILANIQVKRCYYGILNEHVKTFIAECKFKDVPKSLILSKSQKIHIVTPSEIIFPCFSNESGAVIEESDQDELCYKLYVELVKEIRMPYRIAYEHDMYNVISTPKDELEYDQRKI